MEADLPRMISSPVERFAGPASANTDRAATRALRSDVAGCDWESGARKTASRCTSWHDDRARQISGASRLGGRGRAGRGLPKARARRGERRTGAAQRRRLIKYG
jgi:hypothetical protein